MPYPPYAMWLEPGPIPSSIPILSTGCSWYWRWWYSACLPTWNQLEKATFFIFYILMQFLIYLFCRGSDTDRDRDSDSRAPELQLRVQLQLSIGGQRMYSSLIGISWLAALDWPSQVNSSKRPRPRMRPTTPQLQNSRLGCFFLHFIGGGGDIFHASTLRKFALGICNYPTGQWVTGNDRCWLADRSVVAKQCEIGSMTSLIAGEIESHPGHSHACLW